MAFVSFNSQEKRATKPRYLSLKSLLCGTFVLSVERASLRGQQDECSPWCPQGIYSQNRLTQPKLPISLKPGKLKNFHTSWTSSEVVCLPVPSTLQKVLLTAKDPKHKAFYTQALPHLLQKFTEKWVALPAAPQCTWTFLVCRADSLALQTSLHGSPAFCRITESFSFSTWQLPCFSPVLKTSLCFKSTPPSCSFKLHFSLWILQAHQVSVFQTLILWLLSFFSRHCTLQTLSPIESLTKTGLKCH